MNYYIYSPFCVPMCTFTHLQSHACYVYIFPCSVLICWAPVSICNGRWFSTQTESPQECLTSLNPAPSFPLEGSLPLTHMPYNSAKYGHIYKGWNRLRRNLGSFETTKQRDQRAFEWLCYCPVTPLECNERRKCYLVFHETHALLYIKFRLKW